MARHGTDRLPPPPPLDVVHLAFICMNVTPHHMVEVSRLSLVVSHLRTYVHPISTYLLWSIVNQF